MNYSSLLCLDDFHSNPVSENLMHRFILCKLRWKLRVRGSLIGKYWLSGSIASLIKIFKICFLVLLFNNKPLDEQIKYFQIINKHNALQQHTDKIKESNLLHQTTNWTNQQNKPTKQTNQDNRPAPPNNELNQPTNKTSKQTEQIKGTDLLRQSTCSRRQALILEEENQT